MNHLKSIAPLCLSLAMFACSYAPSPAAKDKATEAQTATSVDVVTTEAVELIPRELIFGNPTYSSV